MPDSSSRFTTLRNAFLSGLLLLAPLAVTWIVFSALFEKIGGIFRPALLPFVPDSLRDYDIIWNVLATFIVIVVVTLLGYVSRYVLGKYFGGLAERFIQTIPGVNGVYNSVKQIVATFSTQNRSLLSKVVLVEFPRKGVHTIGFLTNKNQGEAQARIGTELWTVFVPTTPNPTGGYLLLFPKDEIIELDMTVGDGMKMIISGGAVTLSGRLQHRQRPPLRPLSAPDAMAGPSLTIEGVVLLKRPPSDSFQTLTVFTAQHGSVLVLQRISRKSVAALATLDLFDEAALLLESSNQGQTWFVKEARLLTRHSDLGRSYETLQGAAALAQLVARNAVPEESRAQVYALLREALTAFATSTRPDIVYLKSLYRFARDEGYPVKEQWFSNLPSADRDAVAALLNQPVAGQSLPPAAVVRLQQRFDDYLRGHTEILLD